MHDLFVDSFYRYLFSTDLNPVIVADQVIKANAELEWWMSIILKRVNVQLDFEHECRDGTIFRSNKVMELIALSLGLKPERLNGFFKDQTRELRTSMWVVLI
ncbi:hypothetical protein LINPERHAP1_LOCUS1916 [Linum perenne]